MQDPSPEEPRVVFEEELAHLLEPVVDALSLSLATTASGETRWLHRAEGTDPPADPVAPSPPWVRAVAPLSDGTELVLCFRGEGPTLLPTVQALVGAARRVEASVAARERTLAGALREEVLAAELEIAGRIQQTLLFGRPPEEHPRLRVASFALASREVGGDFFDFHQHGPDQVDVVVGDVMGKGVPAALVGSAVKGQFLRFTRGARRDGVTDQGQPRSIVAATHAALAAQLVELETFVTVCYARFDVAAEHLLFVDCGHTHTLLWRSADGTVERLRDDFPPGVNLPFGIDPATRFDQVETSLAPGDLVLFYSDGLTEALSQEGKRFGVRALQEALRELGSLPPEEVLSSLRERVGDHEVEDDLTCVAVRLLAPEGTEDRLELPGLADRLTRVRTHLRDLCGDAVGEEVLRDLELATTEAFTNIVRHAYGDTPGGMVGIEVDLREDAVEVRLYDRGPPLDMERLTTLASTPPAPGERGYGLFLIHNLMDAVEYRREGEENVLVLTRRRQDGREEGEPC